MSKFWVPVLNSVQPDGGSAVKDQTTSAMELDASMATRASPQTRLLTVGTGGKGGSPCIVAFRFATGFPEVRRGAAPMGGEDSPARGRRARTARPKRNWSMFIFRFSRQGWVRSATSWLKNPGYSCSQRPRVRNGRRLERSPAPQTGFGRLERCAANHKGGRSPAPQTGFGRLERGQGRDQEGVSPMV